MMVIIYDGCSMVMDIAILMDCWWHPLVKTDIAIEHGHRNRWCGVTIIWIFMDEYDGYIIARNIHMCGYWFDSMNNFNHLWVIVLWWYDVTNQCLLTRVWGIGLKDSGMTGWHNMA